AAEKADKEQAERDAKDRAAAEKAAKEQAEREARERAATDKKELARLEREAREQAERERKAAEKAEKEAAKAAERERVAREQAEKEAAKAAERERVARERAEKEAAKAAERDAAARERAEKEAAAQAERDRAREEAEAAARREALAREMTPKGTERRADKGVTGTWIQEPRKVLDRNEKRTLNIYQKGDTVEGEIFEETWMEAPSDWVYKSCGGNTTFRMVTSARVSGKREGREVHLRRDVPRVLACTCPSRCAAEQRRRGLDLVLSPSGQQLSDSSGTFGLEGAVAAGEAPAAAPGGAPAFEGSWESKPFDRRGAKTVVRLELKLAGKKLVGTLAESVDTALPLASWADRFCDGAQRFQYVTTYTVAGKPDKRELTLELDDASVLTCSCPSKCREPSRPRPITVTMTADGTSLMYGDTVLERR
ncbi:MAG: hypothetical protein KC635_27660, partial [Myxococcales bacterium]|nr:hypothetical protein [Myxococcales bacterium]